MGKKRRSARRENSKERSRAAREAKELAQAEAERQRRVRAIVLAVLAAATLGAAAGCYWLLDNRQLAGVTLLAGMTIFLLYGLGSIGSAVKKRDRHRAGAIDFGRRD